MSVFKFGFCETKAKPTLVVFVNPGISRDWQAVKTVLQTIFNKRNDIQIEFLPGTVSESIGSPDPETMLSLSNNGTGQGFENRKQHWPGW
jgi:hypothetical protein